ncbi:MAG: hypothetical protein ACI86M_003493 [Saprospiraceae bacterium]|jgi:hypothetical protein
MFGVNKWRFGTIMCNSVLHLFIISTESENSCFLDEKRLRILKVRIKVFDEADILK